MKMFREAVGMKVVSNRAQLSAEQVEQLCEEHQLELLSTVYDYSGQAPKTGHPC